MPAGASRNSLTDLCARCRAGTRALSAHAATGGMQAQAEGVKRAGLEQYAALKGRILKITTALVAIGLAASAATGGADAAEAFALGGAIALVYQVLLTRSVDALPLGGVNAKSQDAGLQDNASSQDGSAARSSLASIVAGEGRGVSGAALLGAAAPRIALVASVLLAAVWGTQSWDSAPLTTSSSCQ